MNRQVQSPLKLKQSSGNENSVSIKSPSATTTTLSQLGRIESQIDQKQPQDRIELNNPTMNIHSGLSPIKLGQRHNIDQSCDSSIDSLCEEEFSQGLINERQIKKREKEEKRKELKQSSKYLWDFSFEDEKQSNRNSTKKKRNHQHHETQEESKYYDNNEEEIHKRKQSFFDATFNTISNANRLTVKEREIEETRDVAAVGDNRSSDSYDGESNSDEHWMDDMSGNDIPDEDLQEMFIKEIDLEQPKQNQPAQQMIQSDGLQDNSDKNLEGWGETITSSCTDLNHRDELSSRLRGLLGTSTAITQKSQVYQKVMNPFGGQLKRDRYWDKRAHNFVCASSSIKENHNATITDELEKLLRIYEQEKDIGRQIAYRKAVGIIKGLKEPILKPKDVEAITGIGDKIRQKVKEILATGVCQKAQNLTKNERNTTITLLCGVWGIGPAKASELFEAGIKSIPNLRRNTHLLNRNQKIGLQFYEDILDRMPRSEAEEIRNAVFQGMKRLYGNEVDRYDVIACGSFRRGKETCGDVDILICRKDGEDGKPKRLMLDLIEELERVSLLIAHLQLPKINSHGSESYMGVCRLPRSSNHDDDQERKARRLDIKYYPKDQFGYALLYFTGSDYFNRSMRLFARKKGYSLADHGLYPVTRTGKHDKIRSPLTIPCYTEEQVFAALNLEFKPPNMRSI